MASFVNQVCPQPEIFVHLCLQGNSSGWINQFTIRENPVRLYTHWTTPHSGVQKEYIEEFIRLMDVTSCVQKHCCLSMDEMKIKSGLVFNKHTGKLVGFVDLGSVNHEIELLANGGSEPERALADQVFVFMARAVFEPSLSLPIAHYFSHKLKGKLQHLPMHESLITLIYIIILHRSQNISTCMESSRSPWLL